MPAETHVEGEPMERNDVVTLVKDRLAEILEIEPSEIDEGFSFSVTENDFIQAGIKAREKVKATSRAAERRTMRLEHDAGGETITSGSEIKNHDLWDDSDPKNW